MTKTSLVCYRTWNLTARLILAGVFIYAGILKMGSPLEFADTIASFKILPAFAINLVALGLPPFEIACGLLVLMGLHLRIGTLGMLGMLVVFMGAVIHALIWKLPIDCGCFGEHSWFGSSLWIALARDGVLLFLSAFVYVSQFEPRWVEKQTAPFISE